MPPRLPVRPGLLCRSAASPSSLVLRPYSTSPLQQPSSQNDKPPSLATDVPPESPRYVKYPKPRQSEEHPRPDVKGHMPVPRDVFRAQYVPGRTKDIRHKWAKKSDATAFTESAAPLSKAEQRGEEAWSEREIMRRRLAANRREGLLAGLRGLWTRQQETKRRERARSTNLANRNRRAALATPEGRDDVLTRSSVRDATAKTTAVIRDPLRHEKQAASAARTAAIAQAKKEARRDALMELYHAAGKFIVDEQDLERRVSELFRPDYFKEEGYSYGSVNAENIWDVVGRPASVRDLMQGITRTETKLFDSKRTELDRTTKRQKLVAEALTGGKMPV
ncbi:uncharacterized protein SPSK_09554 [Sporothrix schenckii 1099-18]|uniref:Uncharacterized protein n=2 Tax=Sporothrix schenckii TaxID=29908 RepID=U7PXQ2_SPOS1|nr:uncharacterized protein SPSK_09554 [Sporothrix schenckii 1099-18]ERS99731.1 hypothetical protein HMPREF1624_03095 [Sporothrix schenckii ATCC 58251]KJR85893.1 hypothetical protein SPSK_09554 [Sporothrix schenckii 1099-18]